MDAILGMQVFCKVVDTENFTEAGRRLNLSPPMVTRHIQALERRLGTRLVNRTTHQFSLTEAGAHYYERCARLLGDFEDVEESVRSLSQLPQGRLRLTAPVEFGRVELWPAIREFMLRHPQIQIDLYLTNRVVDLFEEGADLALRVTDSSLDGSLIARKLATSRQVVCAAPSYLRRHGVPRKPDDLRAHRCLLYGADGRHPGWEFSRRGRTRRVAVPGCLQSNQVGLLRDAVVEGTGIAIQPSFNVWREVAAGRLRTLLDGWNAGTLSIYVVFPSRAFLPVKTRLFIDHLTDVFGGGPDSDPWLARAGVRAHSGRRPREGAVI